MPRQVAFRLPVGHLVGSSLGIYFRNLIPFTFLGALVMSPWIALRLYWAGLPSEQQGGPMLLSVLLQSVLGYLLTGAVTYGVVMQLRGEPAGLAACLSKGAGSFFRVLGTGLLCGLRIALWSLLLLVPGIIETVRLWVAIPVAVMEDKAGSVAAQRSVDLVRGSGWPLFAAYALVLLLGFGLLFVGAFLMAAMQADSDPESPWLDIVLTVPLQAFGATMMSVAYFLLRKGKENVDAAAIAKVFD